MLPLFCCVYDTDCGVHLSNTALLRSFYYIAFYNKLQCLTMNLCCWVRVDFTPLRLWPAQEWRGKGKVERIKYLLR